MKLIELFGCMMQTYSISRSPNTLLLDCSPLIFITRCLCYTFSLYTDWSLASRLLQLADSFMAEQDQAIHGCLSRSIQEAHSLLDWAGVALAIWTASRFCQWQWEYQSCSRVFSQSCTSCYPKKSLWCRGRRTSLNPSLFSIWEFFQW